MGKVPCPECSGGQRAGVFLERQHFFILCAPLSGLERVDLDVLEVSFIRAHGKHAIQLLQVTERDDQSTHASIYSGMGLLLYLCVPVIWGGNVCGVDVTKDLRIYILPAPHPRRPSTAPTNLLTVSNSRITRGWLSFSMSFTS